MVSPVRFRLLLASVVMTTLAGVPGCALWQSEDAAKTVGRSPLKQVTPQLDAIELEVYFVERPSGDPLLGNALWTELDQISTLDPAVLTTLRRNGFRFGVAGSDPPRNLQAALGLTGRTISRTEEQNVKTSGTRYSRRSGQEISIDAWPMYQSCEITMHEAGKPTSQEYQQARCVFRVKPERLQDGWARIEFLPEIHHGEMKMRTVPGDQTWNQLPSQLIDPLYDQRFTVELNLGELVVLAAEGDDSNSAGHHFFRGGTTGSKLQRLLIVRLADMKRLDPVYE